jgi:hypothetical protein
MGVAFAEIGSLRLTGTLDSSQSRIIRDPAARALQVAESRGGISGRSTGTFRFPDIEIGQHSTDGLVEVDGLVRKIISRHISPVAISLDVPVALGEVRCVASVMGALSRISGPLGRSNGHSNPDRSIHVPVVLSFGAAVCYRQTDSILEALAAGGALLANPFLWIKIGPGWTRAEFQNVIETALNLGYQGLVVGSSRLVSWPERARLSGAPAFAASNQLLEWAWAVHKGAIPMIASGGVTTGEEAFQKILRGASAVEVLSALWLRGPFAARLVCAELHAELRRFGASSISDLTGVFYEDF